jgi:uncharacterized protein YodC (DUF2158 family)
MAPINPALERLWQMFRKQNADIVAQPIPMGMLILLCELNEKEQSLTVGIIKPGDIVRLKAGSKEMIVSKVLDANTVECTYFDGEQQFTAATPVADVEKVAISRRSAPAAPSK